THTTPAHSAGGAGTRGEPPRRNDGSQSSPSATGTTPTSRPIRPYPRKLFTPARGVSTAAAISFVVSIPVQVVTPTASGSSSTHAYGTTIVAERRRPSVESPSTE